MLSSHTMVCNHLFERHQLMNSQEYFIFVLISLHQKIIHNHSRILIIVYFHLMENIMHTASSYASVDMIFNVWHDYIWACIFFEIIQCWENFATATYTFTMG